MRGRPRDKSYKPYYVGKDRRQYRRSREDPTWRQVDLDALPRRVSEREDEVKKEAAGGEETTNVMDRALEASQRLPGSQRREIEASESLERAPCRGRPRDKSYKPYYRARDRRQLKSSKLAAERAERRYLRELREDEKAEERVRKACVKIDSEGNPIEKPTRLGGRKKRTVKK
ncbi:hypothetical protein FOL47_000941 [Perkinsus chesapeaki]|uniref:Uncharacterized protein n=1 Tax=Perkinsus chesapeaki TaxID=330153 RepID=A0A7J6N0Z9_PERCH|nr:hypothetical protein FOL47_000941 [Perkinsus chesapeaki]